jgi:protein-S-isoprenylcysteine O-methyltransferase Ste14
MLVTRVIFGILLWLSAAIRGYYTLRFGLVPMKLRKPREWYDWAAEMGAWSVAVVGPLYVLLGERLPLRFANETWARVCGLAIFALGIITFAGSHRTLAHHWTWNIGLRDNHQIVRHGIYRYVRHPMYTAIGAWLIAMPFITQSWLGFIPLVGLIGLYRRARVEEALLTQTFGAAYETYRKQTGLFLPKL